VLDCIQPLPDEIVLPKTSSSVFGSTAVAFLLRNMGIDQLVIQSDFVFTATLCAM
jgi:nicotinamidase-related amidase